MSEKCCIHLSFSLQLTSLPLLGQSTSPSLSSVDLPFLVPGSKLPHQQEFLSNYGRADLSVNFLLFAPSQLTKSPVNPPFASLTVWLPGVNHGSYTSLYPWHLISWFWQSHYPRVTKHLHTEQWRACLCVPWCDFFKVTCKAKDGGPQSLQGN